MKEDILAFKSWVALKTLQRFQGKCISFSLAVPMAKLYIREMSSAMLALVHAIKALPQELCNGRLDAYADSQVMIGAWNVQGSKKSPQLTRVTKQLFFARDQALCKAFFFFLRVIERQIC